MSTGSGGTMTKHRVSFDNNIATVGFEKVQVMELQELESATKTTVHRSRWVVVITTPDTKDKRDDKRREVGTGGCLRIGKFGIEPVVEEVRWKRVSVSTCNMSLCVYFNRCKKLVHIPTHPYKYITYSYVKKVSRSKSPHTRYISVS